MSSETENAQGSISIIQTLYDLFWGKSSGRNKNTTGVTRITRRFKVTEMHEDFAWLRLLEGEKRGLDFAIGYGGYRDSLSEGETVVATVESLNKRNTKWEIHTLHTTKQ